ncbi:hypothetical protein [Gracilibacillus timonensis]|uniref:hypothetical protein n=1 Tax=Gracilibacillus timonensis TaxID=1816696 RepID=UPI000AACB2D7|nr:hypothetical protein [Gracilibacillus timonensis]
MSFLLGMALSLLTMISVVSVVSLLFVLTKHTSASLGIILVLMFVAPTVVYMMTNFDHAFLHLWPVHWDMISTGMEYILYHWIGRNFQLNSHKMFLA